jgi:hypothetical protein
MHVRTGVHLVSHRLLADQQTHKKGGEGQAAIRVVVVLPCRLVGHTFTAFLFRADDLRQELPCRGVSRRELPSALLLCACCCVLQVVANAPSVRLTASEAKVPLEREWKFSEASPGETL